MNDTNPESTFTVHTLVSELVADVAPSLLVVKIGVNVSPTDGVLGRFEIDTDALALPTFTC
jgi:hypothetical protein